MSTHTAPKTEALRLPKAFAQPLDIVRQARQNARIDWYGEARAFARLADSATGTLRSVAECMMLGHSASVACLHLDIEGAFLKPCDRCGEPLMLPFELASRLAFADSASGGALKAADIPGYECADYDARVTLATIVEDEILLAYPSMSACDEADLCPHYPKDWLVASTIALDNN